MRRRAAVLSMPLLAQGLFRREARAQSTPVAPSNGNHAPPAGSPALDSLGQKIEANYTDVESVVVLRGDRLLFEHYKSGAGPDTLRDVQSVTKSVLSLAVGAAVGQGAIRSVDQPVSELLPALRLPDVDSEASPLRVHHLLTMTAGFRPQERFAVNTADDPAFLLRRERSGLPGAGFAYDNLAANLLSIALKGATGQATSRFAGHKLFRPLGIDAFAWESGANGHTYGFSGLRLRTRDMAKLGQIALRTGNWHGAQIVPEAYARSAVTLQNPGGQPVGLAYGYLWWVVPTPEERRTFLASGWGGQFIWVHPPLDMVIATTSAVSAQSNQRGQALTLIRNELFGAASATSTSASSSIASRHPIG
jgi:CubicO group peptidase (beta-lactamase class C family)